MKVVYKTILTDIDDKIEIACIEQRTIDYIELNGREWNDFRFCLYKLAPHVPLAAPGTEFVRNGVLIRKTVP